MQKKRIEYNSEVDALVAVAKRLSKYENLYNKASEEFYDTYCKMRLQKVSFAGADDR